MVVFQEAELEMATFNSSARNWCLAFAIRDCYVRYAVASTRDSFARVGAKATHYFCQRAV
jgi:hypothetical protein